MNAIRIVLSVFILALMGLSVAGWVWWGSNETATPLAVVAARIVLTSGAAAGILGLVTLWRVKLRQT